MVLTLYYQVGVGQERVILNNLAMASKSDRNKKIKKVTELLKYSLSLNDEEIIKSTIESVIEILEDELKIKD